MATRPTWKGYLKLSLVSCPVALYTATSTSQRIRFNIINRKTGNRVHNQVVDAETIRRHLAGFVSSGGISKFAIPERILFVAQLEKTSVGKLNKKLLRERYGDLP